MGLKRWRFETAPTLIEYVHDEHSACRWHLRGHMLSYISVIMVTTLMIRAIYFKWIIISGRLYLVRTMMRPLTDILPNENGWRGMSYRRLFCVSFSPCVSPPHRHFTSLSFGSILESQVRSSQVLPFQCTTARLGILREVSENVRDTQSQLCFYWIMMNLLQQFDAVYHSQLSSCSACLRYSAALDYQCLWGVDREWRKLCDAPLIQITALSFQIKYDDWNSYLTRW